MIISLYLILMKDLILDRSRRVKNENFSVLSGSVPNPEPDPYVF